MIVLHIVTVLIVLRCLQWQPLVMNVLRNGKVEKLTYFEGHWLDLAQIWNKEVFLDSESKIKFYIESF